MTSGKPGLAYIASEIPALSETFVYNEILCLRERGYPVLPVSVRRPTAIASDVIAEFVDILYLYERGIVRILWAFAVSSFTQPRGVARALSWLLADLWSIGVFRRDGLKLLVQFLTAATIAQRMVQNRIAHIHAHFSHVPTQLAMYAAGMAGIPFSFTVHANDIFQHGLLIREKAERAKKVVAISRFNRDILISHGVCAEKLAVVRCGIPKSFLEDAFRSKRQGATVEFSVGSLGRLVPKKGMDTLVQAAGLLKNRGQCDLAVSIRGSGPDRELLALTIESNELDDVVSLVGVLNHSKLAQWLATLDLFVLPCRVDTNGDKDGIPIVLMEAMAAGIPVISTTISGIPELIDDGDSGLLIPPDDPQALADAIERMRDDAEFAAMCAKNARRKIAEEFSLERSVTELEEIFAK